MVIDTNMYTEKVQALLAINHFLTLPKDPTEKYQKLIHKTQQQCNLIIDKQKIKYLTQKKPLHRYSKHN
jgi:hypothetical protein